MVTSSEIVLKNHNPLERSHVRYISAKHPLTMDRGGFGQKAKAKASATIPLQLGWQVYKR